MRNGITVGLLVVMLWTTVAQASPVQAAGHSPGVVQVGFKDVVMNRIIWPLVSAIVLGLFSEANEQHAWTRQAVDAVEEQFEARIAPRALWVQYLLRSHRVASTMQLCDVALASETHNQNAELTMFGYCKAFQAQQEEDLLRPGPRPRPEPESRRWAP